MNDKYVLSGFMGSGKTTVGRLLAERLGGGFLDMDEHIEERLGLSVEKIFETLGEAAFREAEREACLQAAKLDAKVLAVGGGAVLSEDNRRNLAEFGHLICLSASTGVLADRLGQDRERPLLKGGEVLSRISRLLEERRDNYDAIPWQIDTTFRTVEEVCDAILASTSLASRLPLGMARLAVKGPQGSYDVCVGSGTSSALGELVSPLVGPRPGRLVLVADRVVRSLHGDRVASALRSAGLDVVTCEIPEGEEHKTIETLSRLYSLFIEAKLDRDGTVIALGGGVTGDLAGFAAATYLRGVRVIQVPTTLLAMVDASIGGKTAVDLPEGKNLVGAFKQPALVVADPDVLCTLPRHEVSSGMAEVIKHGVIADSTLFARVEEEGCLTDPVAIRSAMRVKIDVVNEDPLERGRRAVLNLGHTFAHGFEQASDYEVPHGVAVGVGLRAAALLGVEMGITKRDLEARIVTALSACDLPTELAGISLDQVRKAMETDKKRAGGSLRFVVPRALGDVVLTGPMPERAIRAALEAVLRR